LKHFEVVTAGGDKSEGRVRITLFRIPDALRWYTPTQHTSWPYWKFKAQSPARVYLMEKQNVIRSHDKTACFGL